MISATITSIAVPVAPVVAPIYPKAGPAMRLAKAFPTIPNTSFPKTISAMPSSSISTM